MAYIQKRQIQERTPSGRVKSVATYRVRYRDWSGHLQSETFRRASDAERRKAQIESEPASGTWRDPRRGEIRLRDWAQDWVATRHDLRATTRSRLETTMRMQVVPKFGALPLIKITNADVRAWVAEMLDAGLSAASTRRRCSRSGSA